MRAAPSTTRTSLRAAPRLVRRRASTLMSLDDVLALLGDEEVDEAVEVDLVVPDLELPLGGGAAQRQAVGLAHGHRGLGSCAVRQADLAGEHLEAGRQALHVPLEGPGQGFVEVAQVIGQVPLGRRPEAEVQDVGVTAQLDLEPGVLGGGQVGGHDRRGPAIVGPRRCRHASMADGDQRRDAVMALGQDHLQRVVRAPRRVPLAEGAARDPVACRTAGVSPLVHAGAGWWPDRLPCSRPHLVEGVDGVVDVEPAEAGEAGGLSPSPGAATRGGRACPGPAPPGSDSAEDRHDSTDTPYMSAVMGFLATFSAYESRALMSTSSHVPSSRERGADGRHHLLGMGHVVDAVERRHQVHRPVGRQRLLPGVVEVGVRQAQLGPAPLGPLQGEVGDVVAVDLAGRVGLATRQTAMPAPQPTSATVPPASNRSTTPSSDGRPTGRR